MRSVGIRSITCNCRCSIRLNRRVRSAMTVARLRKMGLSSRRSRIRLHLLIHALKK